MKAEPIAARLYYRGGFPVYLARYVIVDGNRAALRFFNGSEYDVTGVRFCLVEKDGEGNVLSEHTAEAEGFMAERGEEFAVPDVAVSEECAALEARVTAVFSGEYEYLAEGDGVRLVYGKKREEKRETMFSRPSGHSSSKRKKLTVLFAAVAVLGLALIAGGIAWRLGLFDKVETASASAVAIRVQE